MLRFISHRGKGEASEQERDRGDPERESVWERGVEKADWYKESSV